MDTFGLYLCGTRDVGVRRRGLLFLSIFLLVFGAEAKRKKEKPIQHLRGVVERCHDGDTCRVLVDGHSLSIRFSGIDTPELKQKYGLEAQRFTETFIKGKDVDLECNGRSFNRITCVVFLNGVDVNKEIVRQGWAFESKKYSQGKYSSALQEAQSQRLGMWKEGKVVSPHCFRHKKAKACRSNMAYMP